MNKRRINLVVDEELYAQIQDFARSQKRTVANLLVHAITGYLRRYAKKTTASSESLSGAQDVPRHYPGGGNAFPVQGSPDGGQLRRS